MGEELIVDDIREALQFLKYKHDLPKYLVLSSYQIINNWDKIINDPDNNRPDIKTPEKYIKEAKKGEVTAGGAKVIISDWPN